MGDVAACKKERGSLRREDELSVAQSQQQTQLEAQVALHFAPCPWRQPVNQTPSPCVTPRQRDTPQGRQVTFSSSPCWRCWVWSRLPSCPLSRSPSCPSLQPWPPPPWPSCTPSTWQPGQQTQADTRVRSRCDTLRRTRPPCKTAHRKLPWSFQSLSAWCRQEHGTPRCSSASGVASACGGLPVVRHLFWIIYTAQSIRSAASAACLAASAATRCASSYASRSARRPPTSALIRCTAAQQQQQQQLLRPHTEKQRKPAAAAAIERQWAISCKICCH